jgi:N-acyl-D-amino-acid deacylase
MAPYGGIYVTHLRGEGNNILPALREAIRIGEEAGVSTFISHLKVMGERNRGASVQLLREMDEAISRGLDLWADQYPYTAGSAPLYTQLPPKYLVGGLGVWLENIKKPEVRARLLHSIFNETEEFESGILHAGFDRTLVIAARQTPQYVNKTLGQIARERGVEPVDAMCDLLCANNGVVQCVYFYINVPDMFNIMAHPRVLCGSDTSNWAERFDPESIGGGHPRSAGTMVRRLELVRDFRLRTMEESIKNVTWDASRALKLGNHGQLREGWDANITVMEYDKLHASADYVHPRRRNTGIHWVLVNGVIAVENGASIPNVRAGKVIKRAR